MKYYLTLIAFLFICLSGLTQNSVLLNDVKNSLNEIEILIEIDVQEDIFISNLDTTINSYTCIGVNKYQISDTANFYKLSKVQVINNGELLGFEELAQIELIETCLQNYQNRNLISEADSLNILSDFKLDVISEIKNPTQNQINYINSW